MAVFTITVDGVAHTSTSLDILLIDETRRPFLSKMRYRIEKVYGRPGNYDYGSDVGSLEIRLSCVFSTDAGFTSSADLRAAATTLLGLLLDPATGKPAKIGLAFSDVPSKSWTASLNDPVRPEMLTANYGKFDLTFICHDPFAHEVEDEVSGTITTSPGTLEVTTSGIAPTPAVYIVKNTGLATIGGFTLKRVKEV